MAAFRAPCAPSVRLQGRARPGPTYSSTVGCLANPLTTLGHGPASPGGGRDARRLGWDLVDRREVWIARIIFPPDIEIKLGTKHGLSAWEVEEACLFGGHRDARWHDHSRYGRRLLVRGETYAGSSILAVLGPIDEVDGVWECRTARRLT